MKNIDDIIKENEVTKNCDLHRFQVESEIFEYSFYSVTE